MSDSPPGFENPDLSDGDVTTYPNPFSSQTTLEADYFFNDATPTVYNSLGQVVQEISNISGQTVTFYRDKLPGGLYFTQLTQDRKVVAAGKVIITE